MAQRYTRFTRHMAGGSGSGGSRTAPSSPETHKEEEPVAVPKAPDVTESPEPPTKPVLPILEVPVPAFPAQPVSVKSNQVLVHVADYVSSDCVDSVDSDDQQSLARIVVEYMDDQPFPESSDDELPDEVTTPTPSTSAGVQAVTASQSDGEIYTRQCVDFDVSTSSLNRQTQCCMSFKAHPKSSRKKSQSHSCHVV